jgi:hypothetical protein
MYGRKLNTPLLNLKNPPRSDSRKGECVGRQFQEGDPVYAKATHGSTKWHHGTVIQKLGHVVYLVKVSDMQWRCHINQLRKRETPQFTYDQEIDAAEPGSAAQRAAEVNPTPQVNTRGRRMQRTIPPGDRQLRERRDRPNYKELATRGKKT